MKYFKSPIEYILLVLFILYLVLPINLPEPFAKMVETPLGVISLFLITIAIFVYINPILGVLYIFVAYELLRRSSYITNKTSYIEYTHTPSQIIKDENMRRMNPPLEKTLEEMVVQKMAPIGESMFVENRIENEKGQIIRGAFQPVSENIHNAESV
jgi:hypothetical protein